VVPAAEIEGRLAAFRARLAEEGLAGAVVVDQTDLYYLSGTAQSAHLVVPAQGEPVLLVRRDLERARAESPLERVDPLDSLRDLPGALRAAGVTGGRVGFELDVLPASLYLGYARRLEGLELADCSAILRRLRAVKSPWELERMRAAAAQIEPIGEWVAEVAHDGITEVELAAEVDRRLRVAGHQGVVRFRGFNQEMTLSSILSGPSAAAAGASDTPIVGPGTSPIVPRGASRRPIRRGEPIVVDLVGASEGYLADQTRTYSLGPLDERFAEPLARARAILAAAADEARPGVPPSSLYALAVERSGDLAGRFMGGVRFLGHGIGLEIDELPVLAPGFDEPLAEGNVVAIEPKFVFPGEGAVGIENSYVMTASGAEPLTTAPEDLVEL
jgi:Xaa-Pro aminopeptidase